MKRKFPVTAFCVAQPGCICRWVTVHLTQPECPHEVLHVPDNGFLYALQYSEMPSCVLLPSHMLCVELHFNRFCHKQPKVLNSLSHSFPGPFPASRHSSTMALQDLFPRSAALCETLNTFSWAWRKMQVKDLPCLPLQPSWAPAVPSWVWQQTLSTGLGKSERVRGEHKGGFGKINAMGACTELSSQGVFQWH